MPESIIRDYGWAEEGVLKIQWVQDHMPILKEIRRDFETRQPFKGKRVGICLHLEAKTAYLATVIKAGGAEVAVCGSNPLSTQDDVCAGLVSLGVTVYARHGCPPEEYTSFLHKVLDTRPHLIIDDGGDLVHLLHTERKELLPDIIGGAEETTTGILRLKAMERDGVLAFPMVAVNDGYCKHLFDNRYGTGQSTWDGIMRTTNLTICGKTVVVAGYGWCGKGIAARAKGLGARVIVTEVNPIHANEALMDGFEVMPMVEAAKYGDIFVTATGCANVIRGEHFKVMKDGAILANAGHFDVEINKKDLQAMAQTRRVARRNVEEFRLPDGRRLYLLAEGRLVNIAAADGHPAEIMDLTFALQALSLDYVLKNKGQLPPKVISVPWEIDREVASLRLRSLGVKIDTLTPEQEKYLASWRHD
ncbi:adenosylhomocysteinase [Thermanaeromonas sp. C210]|uniref:adenosylhomocysteinase n=1 Tax=Thermanaeromonas sp. C210 TaxID=2731925 RepID=UPI00155C60C1|nr:adenosylhomocysteinase [Thermanaeromonas sp. C210]GFN22376.1 adenosylhomocysteinase [Thermanaeromonas sp. C210]